ncbi:MAG: hypothetical protein ABI776_03460 [Nocardioidaceae bacterium]
MTEVTSVSATSALNAVVWVFAGMTIVVILVFGATMWLAIRHRRQRTKARPYLDDPRRWRADPAGVLDILTVGDLIGDPQLREAVLSKRTQLADMVATRDATDVQSESPSDPEAPTPR